MSSDCKPIDFAEARGKFRTSSDCGEDEASRALYEQLAPKVVQLKSRNGDAATGFFVNNGDEILTDGHAAAHSPAEIITADGKKYQTRLEKLDEVHDLALLKVIGIEPDVKRAVDVTDAATPEIGGMLTAIGHPLGREHAAVATGPLEDRDTLYSYGFGRHTRVIPMLKGAAASGIAEIAKDAQAALDAQRLRFGAPIYPGNSGSVVVNPDAKFAGIVAEKIPGISSGLVTPAPVVREFINQPETKFEFEYSGRPGSADEKLIIRRKSGINAGPLV
jgi:S1-C subfamily serine protease